MTHPKLCDIRRACADWKDEYPPILTLEQAAKIANVAPSTLKRHASEGRYRGSVKRGKPLLFWRDYFLQALMNFVEPSRRPRRRQSVTATGVNGPNAGTGIHI